MSLIPGNVISTPVRYLKKAMKRIIDPFDVLPFLPMAVLLLASLAYYGLILLARGQRTK